MDALSPKTMRFILFSELKGPKKPLAVPKCIMFSHNSFLRSLFIAAKQMIPNSFYLNPGAALLGYLAPDPSQVAIKLVAKAVVI